MKFKHGDRVTCKIDGMEITDARISVERGGSNYICQNVLTGTIASEQFGYKYAWFFNVDSPQDEGVTELKLKERTIKSHPLEEGDVLFDLKDTKAKVLGVCGKVVFLSYRTDFESVSHFRTQKELVASGWRLYRTTTTEQEIKEVTLDEVAKALGIPVEKLRIKD